MNAPSPADVDRTDVFRIAQGPKGRWMLQDWVGRAVDPVREFPTEDEAIEYLQHSARTSGRAVEVRRKNDGSIDFVRVTAGPQSSKTVTLRLVVPEALNDLIEEMIPDAGKSNVEVIARAAILLKYALDVEREGKRLAVIDDDLNVDREVTGIFPNHGS